MDQLVILSAVYLREADQNDEPAGPLDGASDKPPNIGCVIL